MLRQFTATAYVISDGHVLLISHPKYRKWNPPGGHVEANETPCEAVIREVSEETGVEVELLKLENIWCDYPNARSLIRPYMMLLEEIPARAEQPAHQHIDMIYLAMPVSKERLPIPTHQQARWFSRAEVDVLSASGDIFPDVRDTLLKLLPYSFT